MIDPDSLWRSLVQRARRADDPPPLAMPDAFAQRVLAHVPAARAATQARERERWVFRAAAAAILAAAVTIAWQWPAFAGSTSQPVVLEDIVSLEPVP